ncbi:D-allulose-6-phosphate 3-epimerase [Oenococcus oeni]|uniref:D-allulose 6-phosphate 3-epimerase n=1 Tax=Oenococcus oeni TaxID=1247 RepID=UPI00107A638D|nr:D-allulose 6-phosphate 3-epimerase [Oenococcus oeni]AVI94390.1 allulose-6-phosphate 3-epimerase [Oenococcus oeni]SYW02853.1 D-allulose-6-phosphate 3-epimerase [Oenococcus oeni]SYW03463.1 D-allulose-6-phosphate 3-epimerase [Oenococcus oeni]SYW19206.1 D-allulose-6-phosphate 3-epimerase [Oenococcus oeni]VDC14953.1 D-allulose-6-phosphate 3-epimerase [Oenococcus oeni]
MNIKFSPSLMTMDLDKFSEQIGFLKDKVDSFHVDIMDGHFVSNLSLSPWFIEQVKKVSDTQISAHLMVEDPSFWTDRLIDIGTDFICFPAETVNGIAFRLINKIHSSGLRAGVVLNPETSISSIESYIDKLDKITIMTVDPGFAGEIFIKKSLEKIVNLRKEREKFNYHFLIEMDGSSNKKSFSMIHQANPDIYIVGRSGLFGLSSDIETSWQEMIKNFETETGVKVNQFVNRE